MSVFVHYANSQNHIFNFSMSLDEHKIWVLLQILIVPKGMDIYISLQLDQDIRNSK